MKNQAKREYCKIIAKKGKMKISILMINLKGKILQKSSLKIKKTIVKKSKINIVQNYWAIKFSKQIIKFTRI